jgi:hypothetical protein
LGVRPSYPERCLYLLVTKNVTITRLLFDDCRTCATSLANILLHQMYLANMKYEETKNSCFLFVKSGNESRHLIFWLLGTLTGLRDRVWRLIAQREGTSTLNMPYLS